MPRDYARSSRRKKSTSRRKDRYQTSKSRSKLLPLFYIIVGIGLSYAYQHPQQAKKQLLAGVHYIEQAVNNHRLPVREKQHKKMSIESLTQKVKLNLQSLNNKNQESTPKEPAVESKKPELKFYDLLKHAKLFISPEGHNDKEYYDLQIGSFMKKESCQNLSEHLDSESFSAHIEYFSKDDKSYCRVMVGSYSSLNQAYEAKNKLYSLGFVGVLRQKMSVN